jgi:multiple sugar transport system ATP-binding protein
MSSVTLEGLTKQYQGGVLALDHLSLQIADGEFMCLVGPSGCGKTTALRMICGLEEISAGIVRIGDRIVNDLAARDRDIALVFQSYALYPHMTVFKNMSFGLELRKRPRAEINAAVAEAARILDLEPLLERKPGQLSGGQRQRVALGRALVRHPSAFLMDEPLSNLDAKLRVQTRAEIARLHRRLGTTMIYVTHDQIEAMTMADRIAVINLGVLEQVGTPRELYEQPRNQFVAGFIGSPAMNFIHLEVVEGTDRPETTRLLGSGIEMQTDENQAARLRSSGLKHVLLGVRPEHLALGSTTDHGLVISAHVDVVEFLGNGTSVHARADEQDFLATIDASKPPAVGDAVVLSAPPPHIHLFDPESGLSLMSGARSGRGRGASGCDALASA